MKSSYELAMERLNKSAPSAKISDKLKQELADLDSQYAAKIAEREISLTAEIARHAGDPEKTQSLREQLSHERKKLQEQLEDKKERLRATGK